MITSRCVGFKWNNYYYPPGCCPGNQAATSLICTVLLTSFLNPAPLTAAAKQPDCNRAGRGVGCREGMAEGGGRLPD